MSRDLHDLQDVHGQDLHRDNSNNIDYLALDEGAAWSAGRRVGRQYVCMNERLVSRVALG